MNQTNQFFSINELKSLGFKKIGKNVQISKLVKFYQFNGTIGSSTRIDDFCVLKGNIEIGRNVHISSFSYLAAVGSKITIGDLTGISSRTTIVSTSDDFSGDYLTNPTVNEKFRKIIKKRINIGKNVSLGSSVVLLPGANLGDSCSIISGSVVSKKVKSGSVYGCKRLNQIFFQKNLDKINKKINKFLK